MKKVIIITGAPGSGKSRKAKELTEGLKTVTLEKGHTKKGDYFIYRNINEDTEAIIVEELDSIESVFELIFYDAIVVNKRGENPFEYEIKLLILVSNSLTKKDFYQYWFMEFIEL